MFTSFLAMTLHFFFHNDSIITAFIIINILFLAGAVLLERTKIKGADEFFGMWLALFLVPKIIWLYATAFFVYNFFIVYKPKQLQNISKKIPGGLGIMLDSATAGFLAFVVVQIICLFI